MTNFDIFPSTYQSSLEKEYVPRLQEAEVKYSENLAAAQKKLDSEMKITAGCFFPLLLTAAFLAGSIYLLMQTETRLYTILILIALPFVCFYCAFQISSFFYVRFSRPKKVAKAQQKLDAVKASSPVIPIRKEMQEKVDAYRLSFAEEVRKQSLRFANSKLIDTIIDNWAAPCFSELIDEADRSAQIEKIMLCASLSVHTDRIRFSGAREGIDKSDVTSEFHFETHRCRELTSPLEQAAICHALASKLQVALMLKYPQDPSGSVPELTMSESDTETAAVVNFVYRAANLDYQAIEEW